MPKQISPALILTLALALALAGAGAALASLTCPPTRDEIWADASSGMTEPQIAAKWAPCFPSSPPVPWKPGGKVVTSFNNFWELLDSCGYHPQFVESLECSIEIRQPTGFFNGTMENVLFCVDLGAGLQPINERFVRVWDEIHNAIPPWFFGVSPPADLNLHFQGNNRQTLKARAILSWFFPVPANNCSYVPIWGNWLDFQIRLDP